MLISEAVFKSYNIIIFFFICQIPAYLTEPSKIKRTAAEATVLNL